MLSQCTTWLTLLLVASRTIAQTTTSCNPTEKTCPDDTALSSSTYTHDFTTSGADDDAWNITAGNVTYTSSGAEFTITKSGDAPTIQSKWYIFFGRVSFFLKAAPSTGIVSSAILESDDLDELDWEWLGGTDYVSKVQSNYFGKGNTTSYDRAAWAAASDTQTTTHNYTISWTSSETTWYVDEVAIRTLNYADAVSGTNYPQTPMNIRIGIWAGGDSGNDEGTIEWAGGETTYSDGPFTMYLEKIEVVNDNPGSSYSYGDLTGDYTSIKVNDADDSSSSSSASSSSSSKDTESGSSTATVAASGTSTGTQTGMWWTASASAALAQAATSRASTLSLNVWQYGFLGMLMLLAVVR
ncbi:glycoside hydrolase family 16 protein [Macroventuria anomochaeta]|uniref:Glycoside hydrolase family 16 protein n=1 Tax=Macroventuria anomochaeta TaxID=301207 RepID=A0ACB6SID9_9PLEO|nr:glycoside hydrolase family 16 protein [Macroventuria anomochaeta]KAF2633956.1 glycoside hydrolase family 16 protein [Macroventuria anomochaeta]